MTNLKLLMSYLFCLDGGAGHGSVVAVLPTY